MRGAAYLPSNAVFCSYPAAALQSDAMGQPSPGTPTSEKPSEDRLDSWKAIATYLRRDVTTVQRWEKREGMPVHRHVHDKRGSVYALAPELDAWLKTRRQSLGAEAGELEPEPKAPAEPIAEEVPEPVATTPRAGVWLALAAVGVL